MLLERKVTLDYEQLDKQVNSLNRFHGEGINLFIDGKKYIDCASGTFNMPLGYSANEVVEAVREQLLKCSHLSSTYTLDKSQEIFNKLKHHLPEQIDSYWFRDITGSTANECAIRIAQKATGKNEIISVFASHHGQSLTTTEVSGNAFRRKSFTSSSGMGLKIPSPNCEKCFYSQNKDSCELQCATRLNEFIEYASSGQVAAFIIEPILGNGGNIVPQDGYFKKIREICDKNDVLIIADEVQTGFGRTGSFFATAGFAKELRPDIITFAKGAGGIGIPVAGVVMRNELDVLEKWEHSTTSGANPLALVAMEATIDYIEHHNILNNVKEMSMLLNYGLHKLLDKYDFIESVSGKGLMFAFHLPNRKCVDRLLEITYKNSLILRASRYDFGTAIKVRPPLIISKEEVVEILKILDTSLCEFQSEQNKNVARRDY